MQAADGDQPPVRRGPGRPPLNRNKNSPAAAVSTTPRHFHDPRSSTSVSAAGGGGQNGGSDMHYVPPHLHPAYRGRGRPPLALGRRPVTGAPPALPTRKPAYPAATAFTPSPLPSRSHSSRTTAAIRPPAVAHPTTSAAPAPMPAGMQKPRLPQASREPNYLLSTGPTNRLVLSLRSGLPSHISWALSRLTFASMHNLEALLLENFPGLIEALLRFPKRLVSAMHDQTPDSWDPRYWEQEERQLDGLGVTFEQGGSSLQDADDSDCEEDDDDDGAQGLAANAGSNAVTMSTHPRTHFQPHIVPSHKRLLDNAVSATLILRNLSLLERNERHFLHFSRAFNALICDLLALPNVLPNYAGPEEWSELQSVDELRVYALDILEITRVRVQIDRRAILKFDSFGVPFGPPLASDLVDAGQTKQDNANLAAGDAGAAVVVAKRTSAATSDHLFNLLVWLLHSTNDRSVLIGCLRCLGAIAAEERNELAFVEADVPAGEGGEVTTSPGVMRKCLSVLPLTHDSTLMESALDCLYQVINVGDNALRLGTVAGPKGSAPAPFLLGTGREDAETDEEFSRSAGDVRSIVRYLARDLIYGRVIWDRTHQLVLHPALHSGIPSAVNGRRREYELLRKRKRAMEGDDKEVAKQRRLSKAEWLQIKDMPEPERLKTWMRQIYEAKEGGEVTQMEFWATYSSQFGPYSQLGGPALLPAAEVIRTVSAVFPGALAMVSQNQKFVVRGVDSRDRGHMRRYECRWKGCAHPETDTYPAVESHIRTHVHEAQGDECRWASCTYVVPQGTKDAKKHLRQHVMTHLPETEEQVARRDAALQEQQLLRDLRWKSKLKSQPVTKAEMANGARFISGPTAFTPYSPISAEWRRIDMERQEAKRRKALNLPTRGTVDLPDFLAFVVTRTPMDPQTGRPIGIASTAGLILRSIARIAATILVKAGSRQQRSRAMAETEAASMEDERFGLPLPPVKTEAETGGATAVDSAQGGQQVSVIGPAGEWAIQAAERITDSLVDVEEELMTIASENDILCPMLNEVLFELHPEPGESIIDRENEKQGEDQDGDGEGEEEDAIGSPMDA